MDICDQADKGQDDSNKTLMVNGFGKNKSYKDKNPDNNPPVCFFSGGHKLGFMT